MNDEATSTEVGEVEVQGDASGWDAVALEGGSEMAALDSGPEDDPEVAYKPPALEAPVDLGKLLVSVVDGYARGHAHVPVESLDVNRTVIIEPSDAGGYIVRTARA